jgi:hypothetical protein
MPEPVRTATLCALRNVSTKLSGIPVAGVSTVV